MSENSSSSGGIGFFGLLGILFIGLKLTDIIDWSWWLVLLPIYCSALFFAIVLLIVVVYAVKNGG